MYSMAYDPRTAAALAQEHIDRQLGITATHATGRAARRAPARDVSVDAPVPSRAPLRTTLTELARRVATSGTRHWARAS